MQANNSIYENVQELTDLADNTAYEEIEIPSIDVGDEVDIKGGTFKIHSIGKKFIILRPVAGTTWIKR